MIYIAAKIGTTLRRAFWANSPENAKRYIAPYGEEWEIVKEMTLEEFDLLYDAS